MNKRDFSRLYEQYVDDLHRFIYYRVESPSVAEDIVSIVFMKAWEHRSSFDGAHEKAWLYRIARNAIIDHYRKKPTLELDDDYLVDEYGETSEQIDTDMAHRRLVGALGQLDDLPRRVIELRFFSRMNVRDVAAQLGKSAENIRIIQYRALKQLRKHYEKK